MGIMRLRSIRGLLAVSLLACACHSCAQYEVRSPADYIGPERAEPPAEANAVAEANAPPIQPATDSEGPLQITIEQATLLSLENNKSLIVQRIDPQITRTFEQEQRAVFDPVLTGQLAYEQDKIDAGPITSESAGSPRPSASRSFCRREPRSASRAARPPPTRGAY